MIYTMFDGIPAQWHKAPEQARRSPNEAAYVFLGIMLAVLSVPAVFLGWALFLSVGLMLQ
ncbi:hypothetical protein B3286c1_0387 [Brucella vulpis]|nr:hypothetical protein BF3285c1_0387 [Brucella vulpis]CUW49224.1 hypothetical protein B3286c1_0387 [Brucella vulpis]